MIVIEVLVLIPVLSYLLLYQKRVNSIDISKRTLTLVALLLFAGSAFLFLVPKISLTNEFEHTKLTVDAWDHYIVTAEWGKTGEIPTDIYGYYSKLPITYAPQIVLHQITGLSLFDSMTVYYLLVGAAGLLAIVGISGEIIKGSRTERIIYAGISGIVYSFLQYFNLLFVQQYPLAIGTVAGLFCLYSFVLFSEKRKRGVIGFLIAGIILAISHPFAPIFVGLLFFVYYLANRTIRFGSNLYQNLISRRAAIFVSLVAIIIGMTYSVFVATGTFETGLRWSELNVRYTLEKLGSQFFESTTSGVGRSFEGRYQDMDNMIYALNWAIPTSTSISVLIFFLMRRLKIEDTATMHLLFSLAIVSSLMLVMTFAFSFVEFAFSRYFGAFALAFNIPLTSYVILKMVKIRAVLVRYSILAVFGVAIISSVTDPTMLPQVTSGGTVLRSAPLYPTELDIVAWNDFYTMAGDENKLIQTNLYAGPIRHYQEINDYQNEIVMNPKNYTAFGDNSYLIIDKGKLDPTLSLDSNPTLDRIYDNSEIYFSK